MNALDYDEIGLQRIVGFIIDITIVSIVIVALVKILNLDTNIKDYLFILSFIIYYIFATYFTEGQTIGKRVFNLKVIDKNLNKIPFYKLVIKAILIIPVLFIFSKREFIVIKLPHRQIHLDGMIPVLYIVYFSFTNSFLHDKVSKTKVIKS